MKKLLYAFLAVLFLFDATFAQFRKTEGGFCFESKSLIVFQTAVTGDGDVPTMTVGPCDERVIEKVIDVMITDSNEDILLLRFITPDCYIDLVLTDDVVRGAITAIAKGDTDTLYGDVNGDQFVELITFFQFLKLDYPSLWRKIFYYYRDTLYR